MLAFTRFCSATALIAAVLSCGAGPARAADSNGDALFAAGDFDAATVAYRRELAQHANDGPAHLGLGTIALYRNDGPVAVAELTKAVALMPQSRPAQGRLLEAKSRMDAGEYVVHMSDGVTVVPFSSDVTLPIVHATIAGKPVSLVIDTGAAGVDLSEAAVKRLGLQTHSAGRGVFAGGQSAEMLSAVIPEIAFGSTTVKSIGSMVLPGAMKFGNEEVDGAIGTRFFSHFIATLDYRNHRLLLRSKSAATAGIAGARVPMLLVGDHFLFARASVNGAAPGWYNIDTGGDGFGIQMTKESLAAAHITPSTKTETFQGGGGDVPVQKFTAAHVQLGIARENVAGFFFGEHDQYGIFPFRIDGTITDQFFRGGSVTFDFPKMQLIIAP